MCVSAPPSNPPPVTIGPAQFGELDAMSGLLQQLFALEADFSFDADRARHGLELLLADERACVLVARSQGRVLGLCTAQLVVSTAEGGYSAWVEDVVVEPHSRGQGIGRELLQRLAAWAASRGARRLQLLVDSGNQPACDFYHATGWQATRLRALRRRPPAWVPATGR